MTTAVVPRDTRISLAGAHNERKREVLRQILLSGVTAREAACEFERQTGTAITAWTARWWSHKWTISRKKAPMISPEDKDYLRGLLVRGNTTREAAKAMWEHRGTAITHQNVYWYRRNWGIPAVPERAVVAMHVTPCDLCGDTAIGERHDGKPMGLEGRICGQCRRELVEEDKQKAARERKREEDDVLAKRLQLRDAEIEKRDRKRLEDRETREIRIRLDNGHLPLDVLDPHFTTWDLRGPALTHWLKGLLRTERRFRLMFAGYADGTAELAG